MEDTTYEDSETYDTGESIIDEPETSSTEPVDDEVETRRVIEAQLDDSMIEAIKDVMGRREELLGDKGMSPEVFAKVAKMFSAMPKFIEQMKLEEMFEVDKLIEELMDLDEFVDIVEYIEKVRVQFFTRARKAKGYLVHGKTKTLSAKDRDLTHLWWDIDISLISWCLRTPMERRRLLHRQLSYLAIRVTNDDNVKPSMNHPNLQEFSATVARFGMEGADQVAFVANALENPRTTPHLKEFRTNAKGQGLLFSPLK